jgi:hypothetical protein
LDELNEKNNYSKKLDIVLDSYKTGEVLINGEILNKYAHYIDSPLKEEKQVSYITVKFAAKKLPR